VFKEGRTRKLEEERDGLERWEKLRPGLVPHIYGFHSHGEMASLLLEYLEGETLQHLVLYGAREDCKRGYKAMVETIGGVWAETLEREPVSARFVSQLVGRLPDIRRVHPEFEFESAKVGGYAARSFSALVNECAVLDDELVAPFRVLIHGDFNTDNVIVRSDRSSIYFIDLHRSRPFDYTQDVSVFMVSNFRMPLFEAGLRSRLTAVSREFFRFGAEFANKNADATYQARVALGVARSLVTSTRFELDDEFSKAMLLRAVYLLEGLLAHRGRPMSEFRFNEDVLEY
jgi:aminoglycoside phosphotransferase